MYHQTLTQHLTDLSSCISWTCPTTTLDDVASTPVSKCRRFVISFSFLSGSEWIAFRSSDLFFKLSALLSLRLLRRRLILLRFYGPIGPDLKNLLKNSVWCTVSAIRQKQTEIQLLVAVWHKNETAAPSQFCTIYFGTTYKHETTIQFLWFTSWRSYLKTSGPV